MGLRPHITFVDNALIHGVIGPMNTLEHRVQVPAYTDRWMRGDRFGELMSVSRKGVARVRMDSGKVCRFIFDDCTRVW